MSNDSEHACEDGLIEECVARDQRCAEDREEYSLRFSREMYPKIALIKSAYAFTDRAYLHLDADENEFYVTIRPKQGCAVSQEDFVNEMLCQCARHEVYEQTRVIRELLVARAMASTMIESPGSTKTDKLQEGAEVVEVMHEEDEEENEILRDWYEVEDRDTAQ